MHNLYEDGQDDFIQISTSSGYRYLGILHQRSNVHASCSTGPVQQRGNETGYSLIT